MNQSNSDVQKLGELIKGIRVAMLTTVDSEGCLHSRPMATQDAEFDGTLWFFTEADSLKIHELERDRHVNLSYANPGRQQICVCKWDRSHRTEITKRSKSSGHRFTRLGFQRESMIPTSHYCASRWTRPSTGIPRRAQLCG